MKTENNEIKLSGENGLLEKRWSANWRISSRQLAETIGVEHYNLLRDIRKMEPSWVTLGQLKFELTSFVDQWNRKQPCYMLKPEEVLFIATKFDDASRAKLVLRWKELEDLRIAEYYALKGQVSESDEKVKRANLLVAASRGNYNYAVGMRDDTIASLRKQLYNLKQEMLRNEQGAIERENMLRAQIEGTAMEGANCTIKQMVRIIRSAGGWATEKYLFQFLWGNKLVDRSGCVTDKATYLGYLAKPDTRGFIDPDYPKKNFRITPKGQERLLAFFGDPEHPYKGLEMTEFRDTESQHKWEQYIASTDARYKHLNR